MKPNLLVTAKGRTPNANFGTKNLDASIRQRETGVGRLAAVRDMTARQELTRAQWKAIRGIIPGKDGDPGRSGTNNRMSVEGMIWVLRTGAPWRDLPERFGRWHTVYQRFRRWTAKGVMVKVFALCVGRNFDSVMVDGTFAKLHQHGAGARRNGLEPSESRRMQKIGRSAGGLSTKLIAVVDAAGRAIRITLTPGNRHEGPLLMEAIDGIDADEVIADKAYGSNANRKALADRGIVTTIPSRSHVLKPAPYDDAKYRTRHLVENLFADIKHFRGVATGYCKTASSYEAFVAMAVWMVSTRPTRRSLAAR